MPRIRNPLEEILILPRPYVIHDAGYDAAMADTDGHGFFSVISELQHIQFVPDCKLVESSPDPLCKTVYALSSRRRLPGILCKGD